MTLTLAEQRYDAQLDCSAEELTARKRQRAEDAKYRAFVRRSHRYLDLARLEAARDRAAEQIAMRDAAQDEWFAFRGFATAEQIEAWKEKHRRLMIPFIRKLEPVTVLPFP